MKQPRLGGTVSPAVRWVGALQLVAAVGVLAGAIGLLFAACGTSPLIGRPDRSDAGNQDAASGDAQLVPQGLTLRLVSQPATEQPSKVTIKFQVTDDTGQPVTDLVETNFTVTEDDEPLSATESDHRIVTAPDVFDFFTVLLLDLSGSVVSDISVLIEGAQALIDALPQGLEVAIYSFDGRRTLERRQAFTTDKAAMRAAIDALIGYKLVDPSTNLYGAVVNGIEVLHDRRDRSVKPQESAGSLVLFTDGTDRASRVSFGSAQRLVASARQDPPSYSFFAVGLGDEIDREVLEALAPDGFEFAEDAEKLKEAFERAAADLEATAASFYQLTYCSPRRDGAPRLTIDAQSRELGGRLITVFSAEDFTGGCIIVE